MIDPQAVIDEARRWIGTPFRHQWSRIDRGADCIGLVRGVAENLALVEISQAMSEEIDRHPRSPNPLRMAEIMSLYLTKVDAEPSPASVVWCEWTQGLPVHLGIVGVYKGRPTLIHSMRKTGVVENGFTAAWRRHVHSTWRFPNVAYW